MMESESKSNLAKVTRKPQALERKSRFSGSFDGQQINSRPKYKRIKIHARIQQKENEPIAIAAMIPGLNASSSSESLGAEATVISTKKVDNVRVRR